MLYVRVNCSVVHGCAVSWWYINHCKTDVFSVVNMYLGHLKFCVVCNNGQRYVNVMLSLTSVISPPPVLSDLSVRTVVKSCTLGVFALGVSVIS